MDILSYLLGKNSSGGGNVEDVNKYFDFNLPTNIGSNSEAWWAFRMVKPEIANLVIPLGNGAITSIFSGCKWSYLPKLVGTFETITLSNAFQNCSNVKEIDISGLIGTTYRLSSTFNGCTSLEKIDIRNLTIGDGATYSSMLNNVPTTCEIIVKDDTTKTWFNTNFSSYTNVKTLEEYETE